MTRRANRRDLNEPALKQVVEQLGCYWITTGPLDAFVFNPRTQRWCLVEVKQADREGQKHEYTDAQRIFFMWARERSIPWKVWRTADDVLRDLNA